MNHSLSEISGLVPFLRTIVDKNNGRLTLEELSLRVAQDGIRDDLARGNEVTHERIYQCLGLQPQD